MSSKEPYWIQLFGVTSTEKIKKWTTGLSIKDSLKSTLKELDAKNPELNKVDFSEIYDLMCEYTHFSPLVMDKDAKNLLIGLPENTQQIYETVTYVSTMITAFLYTADHFKALNLNVELIQSILEKMILCIKKKY